MTSSSPGWALVVDLVNTVFTPLNSGLQRTAAKNPSSLICGKPGDVPDVKGRFPLYQQNMNIGWMPAVSP
jgi:hypothetical protein